MPRLPVFLKSRTCYGGTKGLHVHVIGELVHTWLLDNRAVHVSHLLFPKVHCAVRDRVIPENSSKTTWKERSGGKLGKHTPSSETPA